MSEQKSKRDIVAASEANVNYLSNVLDQKDFDNFIALRDELKDTWKKKQLFRTETEMRFSVLDDGRYPTNAAKYWQCVREQNVFFENLMALSFDYRKNEVQIKKLERKIQEEQDDLEKELHEIELEQKLYGRAGMELTAKDRMREIETWSRLKKEYNDGSFDTKNVNTHQSESYKQILENKAKTITKGTPQNEVFNILTQLNTLDRLKKEGVLLPPSEIMKRQQMLESKENNNIDTNAGKKESTD